MRDQEEIDKYLDKLIRDAEKKSNRIFARQLKKILAEISEMYEKYESEGKLTLADMSRFNRLQNLYDSIARHLIQAFEDAYILIRETRQTVYLQQYYQSAYVYEMASQVQMGFGRIDPRVVEIAISNPIPKLTLPRIMERNRNEIISKIQEAVASGLAAGESYGKMAKRIREAVGFGSYKSRTVARTEAGKAQSKARLDATEKANRFVETTKRWLSTLDLRTRYSHRKLDGQDAGEDGMFEYKGYKAPAPRLFTRPELTINCRCTFITIIDGEVPKVRRSRDYQDAEYQQRLADRIDHYMEQGYTEIAAQKQAMKEVMPPSQVKKWQTFDSWYADNIAA